MFIPDLPRHEPFDTALLSDLLKDYRAVRNKISGLVAQGVILPLKSGLFILAPKYGGNVTPLLAANVLYGPSYVSLDWALAYYGLIPESVQRLTSVTTKRHKLFKTPLGDFEYFPLPTPAYCVGYQWVSLAPSGAWIATPEKALVDKLAGQAHIRSEKQLMALLFEDLRLDEHTLETLNHSDIATFCQRYRRASTRMMVKWLKSRSYL